MTFLEDALAAHKAEAERAERQAVEYDERRRKTREADLRSWFGRDFGREPASVDPETMTARLEGVTLYLRLETDSYHVTRDHFWRLYWTCPECGEPEYSYDYIRDLASLGAAVPDWHPEEVHRCPDPDELEDADPGAEPGEGPQDAAETDVQELVSADSRVAAAIREMVEEALAARANDGGAY